MAKRKYIGADDALNAGLNLEVAPTVQKEITADSQGRYVGQNGLTANDLNMVGTGRYITATDWNQMGPGYSIVTNPYQAASPEQIAERKTWSQQGTNRNDMELMSDDAYREILKYQQDWANATTDEERQAAHDAAEAVRARYGYSGGADGREHLGLMAYTGNSGYDDGDGGYGGGFNGYGDTGYISRWQSQIDALTGAILGRDPFSYDKNKDPLYQQYKESYTRGGQRGMQDTLAQVSARTGGLASSYAQSAAQQTYNNYMAALADKVPELQQLAYSMYMDDIAMDRADLDMLMGLDTTDYGRWSDDRNFNYGAYRDSVADAQWQQNFNYQQAQDALAQQNWQTQWDYQVQQDALAREDALRKLMSGGGGSSGDYYEELPPSILDTLYGFDTRGEAYDFLVRSGHNNTQAENYMNFYDDHVNAQLKNQNLAGLSGNDGVSDAYQKVKEDLSKLYDVGGDPSEIEKLLEESYESGLVTKAEKESLHRNYVIRGSRR